MLIDPDRHATPAGDAEASRWSGHRHTILWKGHFYLPGLPAGAVSAERLAAELERAPFEAVCGRLAGIFGLFVWDREAQIWHVACDNFGGYHIFHDEAGRVGTDFFELAAKASARSDAVDPAALVEFLVQGMILGAATLVPGIRKLQADEVLRIDASGSQPPRPSLVRKRLEEDVPADPGVILRHVEDLARSAQGLKVSVDVTGGFDSRLVACLLDRHGLAAEAGISGAPDSADVALARPVAERLGLKLHQITQTLDNLTEDLSALLRHSGGLFDIAQLHRDAQAAEARLARGVDLFVHGGGGEFLKDFYCHHEFPFYGRRPASLERLYDLRIAPFRLGPDLLTPAALALARDARARALAAFARHRVPTNHETADRITYFCRSPEFFGYHFSLYVNRGLAVAAPFLDRTCALAAMRLPIWSRVMEGRHRALITELRPDVAALRTTDGYTASSRWRHRLPDLVRYGVSEARRGINKLSQRKLGRALLPKGGAVSIDAPGFKARLRALPAFRQALLRLKKLDVLPDALAAEAVPGFMTGRILTLGMTLDRLDEGAPRAVKAPADLSAA
jgi:asparagine synthetase B (glutamine-hydrolysing)